jgi:hypothetical protein
LTFDEFIKFNGHKAKLHVHNPVFSVHFGMALTGALLNRTGLAQRADSIVLPGRQELVWISQNDYRIDGIRLANCQVLPDRCLSLAVPFFFA